MLMPALSFAGRPPLILVLGDSLSAAYGIDRGSGWVALLGERLAERGIPHRVVNASVSGETTAGGLTRLPPLLDLHRPDVLVIQLGANDGLRGLALEHIDTNLTRLIRLGRESGTQVLMVGIRLPPNYGAAYIERFQAIFPTVAEREGVPLAPRLLKGVAEDWALMQEDGLHPNADAQPRLLDNVWSRLESLLVGASDTTEP